MPIVGRRGERYCWLTERDLPQSIGRLSAFMGNAGVLLRAYIYMRMLGREGMAKVSEHATLNANYLLARLTRAGFDAAYPDRRATHELIITLKRQAKELGATAMDFAKRLLDHGMHAPTTYFPLLVPECLLIEPTGDREQGGPRCLHRRHGRDPRRGRARTRARHQRSAYHARTTPG